MNNKQLESIAKAQTKSKKEKSEPKKKSKLRDLGGKKSKKEIKKRMQAASEQGQKRFYSELRL